MVKTIIRGAIGVSTSCLILAVFCVISMVLEIREFQERIQEDLGEWKFYSTDSWNTMTSSRDKIFTNSESTIRIRRQYYQTAAVSGGGAQIEEPTCQCAQQSTGCPAGPAGPPGAAGQPGQPGLPGEAGKPGAVGVNEPHPAMENGCIQCPAGPPGSPGNDGPEGPSGLDGSPGLPGAGAPPGPAGPPGNSGLPGPDGIPGAPGSDGNPGQDGQRKINTPGPIGLPGSLGAPGPAGTPGQSSQGPQGPPGPMGTPGRPGALGMPGPMGGAGQDGLPGNDGEYCKCPLRTTSLAVVGGGGSYSEGSSYSGDTGIGFVRRKTSKFMGRRKSKKRVWRGVKKH